MNKEIEDISVNEKLNGKPLSTAEAAIFLNVSESQIYKLTSRNLIPHYKPTGKIMYFKRVELEEWAFSKRIKPIYEIEMEANNYVTLHKKR